jgi:NAD+ synthase
MPNGEQADIDDSEEVCHLLEIDFYGINIEDAFTSICKEVGESLYLYGGAHKTENHPMVKTNLPARIRMATLYTIAAFFPHSRVVNTCNRSEDYVGYSTKFGDAAGDFSPLGSLTVREVLAIGDELGLPEHLVHKAPADGMCGKTDEDNLGFTYEELDHVILGTGVVRSETYKKIQRLHKYSRHKYEPMPMFPYNPNEFIDEVLL